MATQTVIAITENEIQTQNSFHIAEVSLAQVLTSVRSAAIENVVEGLVTRDEMDTAVSLLRGLVMANPENSMFHALLGLTYTAMGRLDEAMEAYTNAGAAHHRR